MIRGLPPSAKVGALLAAFLVLSVASIWRKTLTSDEPVHLRYGRSILGLDSDRFDNSKMPWSAVNALPCFVGERMGGRFPDEGSGLGGLLCHRTAARLMTLPFGVLLGLYVFRWSRELYGTLGGLLSLTVCVFSPNLIAHSRLITTDVFVACMATVASYHFWRYLEHGGRRRALLSAVTLGLGQLTKYSAVFLYPIFLGIVALRHGRDLLRGPRGARLWDFGLQALLFATISALVINVGFLFNRTFTPFQDYELRSRLFRSLQQAAGPLGSVPVPLPYPYLEGLDWVRDSDDRGNTNGNLYLLGTLRDRRDPDRAFPAYFLVAWVFKVPLATQILVLWSLVGLVRRFRFDSFRRAELHLLAPVLFFAIYFSFFFRTQVGFRFFLLALPFLHVLCGRLLAEGKPIGPRSRRAVLGLVTALVVSVVSYFPHYLSYFNELVWDRKMSYQILADSNIEWGQDRGYLKEYARAHPEAIVHPRRPMAGQVVVSVNRFVGVFRRPLYEWLRESFEPVDRIAGSYLVFDISQEELDRALSRDGAGGTPGPTAEPRAR